MVTQDRFGTGDECEHRGLSDRSGRLRRCGFKVFHRDGRLTRLSREDGAAEGTDTGRCRITDSSPPPHITA